MRFEFLMDGTSISCDRIR